VGHGFRDPRGLADPGRKQDAIAAMAGLMGLVRLTGLEPATSTSGAWRSLRAELQARDGECTDGKGRHVKRQPFPCVMERTGIQPAETAPNLLGIQRLLRQLAA
jgi:hypothetical protein